LKRDLPDFFVIQIGHEVIHDRLTNWARYVEVKRPRWIAPIWKLGKSNGRQWHQPEIRPQADPLDGAQIEKAVGMLPEPNRDALRWFYVYPSIGPHKMRRYLACTDAGLMELIRVGRQMLVNRRI
jgi:hypothetical protein